MVLFFCSPKVRERKVVEEVEMIWSCVSWVVEE